MKKILVILIFLVSVECVSAQTPDWEWVIQAGGSNGDSGWKICEDNNGNLFVIGNFYESTSIGSFNLISYGSTDIFVAKLDMNGNWLWAESAGGNDDDLGNGISTDNLGNVFVTGQFLSSTANFGQFNLTNTDPDQEDIFVAKLDTNGNWLWVESAGGISEDIGQAISSDLNGNIYITGSYGGIANFGQFTLDNVGPYYNFTDIFVGKLDTDGNWIWVESAGGSHYDKAYGISTDNNGNVYVNGTIRETASLGTLTLTSYGELDIFTTKLDTEGNWIWARNAGGIMNDLSYGICNDVAGNVYFTGCIQDSTSFGPFTLISDGGWNIFVAKLDTDGNWCWAEKAGGESDWDIGKAVVTDSNGNVYLTGFFSGTASFGTNILSSVGMRDVFLAKLDADSNWFWAKSAGGNSYDQGNGICINNAGNIYITGTFQDTISFDSSILTSSGESDIFVAKLSVIGSSADNISCFNTSLIVNYPNPFNPSTTIEFSLPNDSIVDLLIFNIKGQKIKSLIKNEYTKGSHSIIWNGDDESGKLVSSGIYYYILNVNGKTEAVRKCLLLK
ncbi:T9SS type A sorting domain-containing protein [Candidatus Cloacimonadota bacterium]